MPPRRSKQSGHCQRRAELNGGAMVDVALWFDFPRDRRKAVFLFLHLTSQMLAVDAVDGSSPGREAMKWMLLRPHNLEEPWVDKGRRANSLVTERSSVRAGSV